MLVETNPYWRPIEVAAPESSRRRDSARDHLRRLGAGLHGYTLTAAETEPAREAA